MPDKSSPKLYYTHNLNPRVAVAVARHLNAEVEFIRYDPMGRDKEAFRPLNPNAMAPLLIEGERRLWETDAIAMRLCRLFGPEFWPDEHREEVMMWVSWSAHHLNAATSAFVFENHTVPMWLGRLPDGKVLEQAAQDFHHYAAILDAILADRQWLVGERLTYADFRAATAMPFREEGRLPVSGYRNIMAWHERLEANEAWRTPFAGLE